MGFDPNVLFAQALDPIFEGDEKAFSSASSFLPKAQRLLDAGEPHPEGHSLLERLDSELSRCSLKKQRLKGELEETRRAYEEIRHRNKALVEILKGNVQSTVD